MSNPVNNSFADYFWSLPVEAQQMIFDQLSPEDLMRTGGVSKLFQEFSTRSLTWKNELEARGMSSEGMGSREKFLTYARSFLGQVMTHFPGALENASIPLFVAMKRVHQFFQSNALAAPKVNQLVQFTSFVSESPLSLLQEEGLDLLDLVKLDPSFVKGGIFSYSEAVELIHANPSVYSHLSYSLRENKELVLELVQRAPWAISIVEPQFKTDPEVAHAAVKKDASIFKNLDDSMKNHPAVAYAAVSQSGLLLEYVGSDAKNVRKVVEKAVENNGLALEFVPEELKEDREIVEKAFDQTPQSLRFASDELKNKTWFMRNLVEKNSLAYLHCGGRPKRDRELLIMTLKKDPDMIWYAAEHLQEDPEILALLDSMPKQQDEW